MRPRLVLFFLSPRLIDCDSYLPVAMEMKAQLPDLDIRFVTFSRENYDDVRSNPTLAAGLARCGTLAWVGGEGPGGRLRRSLRRIRKFAELAASLIRRPGAMLFHGRQYVERPYRALFWLNRMLGGRGFVLARIRMVDEGHHPHRLSEFEVMGSRRLSWLDRLRGRESDGLVHYHDRQEMYLRSLAKFGRTDWPRRAKVGLPSALPSWRALIAEAVETERQALAAAGRNVDEIYSFFSAKGYSSTHLRTPESAQRTFDNVVRSLTTLRPRATILLRPHPLALREPWFKAALEAIGNPNVVLSYAHPEVMVALSRRALVNNPTNILFTTPFGRFIDCSDYRPSHYEQVGEASLAEGYGVVFVNPARDDFAQRLEWALGEEPWQDVAVFAKRERLSRDNPPSIAEVLNWFEASMPNADPIPSGISNAASSPGQRP